MLDALLLAQTACVIEPENGLFLNTLGAAQYRCGRYEDALTTLSRAHELNSKTERIVTEDLAFLAMTHYRHGNVDQAETHLASLRKEMHVQSSEDAKTLLKEAEDLIEGKKPPAGP